MYNVSWFHSVLVLFSAPRVKQPCICSKKIHQLTLWLVFLRLSSFRTRFSGDNLKFLGKFVENIRRKQKKRSTYGRESCIHNINCGRSLVDDESIEIDEEAQRSQCSVRETQL